MGACNIKPFPSLNAMLPKDRLDCLHTLLQVHPTCFAQIVVIPQSLWCQHHRKPWTLAGCSPLLFRISLCSLTAFFFFFYPLLPWKCIDFHFLSWKGQWWSTEATCSPQAEYHTAGSTHWQAKQQPSGALSNSLAGGQGHNKHIQIQMQQSKPRFGFSLFNPTKAQSRVTPDGPWKALWKHVPTRTKRIVLLLGSCPSFGEHSAGELRIKPILIV